MKRQILCDFMYVKYTNRNRKLVVARGLGETEMENYISIDRVSVFQDEKVLELCCTTMLI